MNLSKIGDNTPYSNVSIYSSRNFKGSNIVERMNSNGILLTPIGLKNEKDGIKTMNSHFRCFELTHEDQSRDSRSLNKNFFRSLNFKKSDAFEIASCSNEIISSSKGKKENLDDNSQSESK